MKSQFNCKRILEYWNLNQEWAEPGNARTSPWVSHYKCNISFFSYAFFFWFRFQKDKCAIWLGFVFLRITSLILDAMRLKTDTTCRNPDPKFVSQLIFEMYYSAILSHYFQFLTIWSTFGFSVSHPIHLINVNCDIYSSVGFFLLFLMSFIAFVVVKLLFSG